MSLRLTLLLLLSIITSISLAQKRRVVLEKIDYSYNGQTIEIKEGTNIKLGLGTKNNGDFIYIFQQENFGGNNWRRVELDKTYSLATGEIVKMIYFPKQEEYYVTIEVKRMHYEILFEQAIQTGEVVAINGIDLGKTISTNSSQNNDMNYLLYLKNGSIIKCEMLEMDAESVKIKTADGSIFVFKRDEINKFEKQSIETNSSNQHPTNGIINTSELVKDSVKQANRGMVFYGDLGIPIAIYDNNIKLVNPKAGFYLRPSFGFRFSDIVLIGGGISLNYYSAINSSFAVGLFLNQRIGFVKDKKITPFIDFKEGLEFGNIGANFSLESNLGINHKISEKFALNYLIGGKGIASKANGQAAFFNIGLGFDYKF